MDFLQTYESYEDMLLHLRTEENARRYIAFVKWGGNPKCPHCGHQGPSTYEDKRKVFYCGKCAKQFSSCTNTIFERSHVPLLKWFKAIFELANGNISSVRLAKKLNVNQRTAWKMEQKIRQTLKDELERVVLSGIVEADTAVIGPDINRDFQRNFEIKRMQKIIEKDNAYTGKQRKYRAERLRKKRRRQGIPPLPQSGRPKGAKNIKGPVKNKYYLYQQWLMGMVERKGKIYLQKIGQHSTCLSEVPTVEILSKHIDKEARIITDGGAEFDKVSTHFATHDLIIHEPTVEFKKKDGTTGKRKVKKFVDGDKYTNTMEGAWAHLQRLRWGHHISVSYGHLDRYLYEFAFQWNNRELTDGEKFQIILRSALKMVFPYSEFKSYSRIYRLGCEGREIGERIVLRKAG